MRPTFSGFEVAKSGINAARANLQVTGQNITNANTIGYTRQRVDLYSIGASGANMRYADKSGAFIGSGVKIGGVSQYRDPYLDTQYRQQNTLLSGSQAELDALSELEYIFDSVMKGNISDSVNTILKSLNNFSQNNTSIEYDKMVKNSASNMLSLLDSLNTQVERVRSQQTEYLESGAVAKTNNLLENIAIISDQIKKSNVAGDSALELIDHRNNMLDELTQYMDIEIVYNPVSVGSGVTVEELEVSLLGDGGEKFNLISNDEYKQIEMSKAENGDIYLNLLNKDKSPVLSSKSGNVSLDGGLINKHLNTGMLSSYLKILNEKGSYDINYNDLTALHLGYLNGSAGSGAIDGLNSLLSNYDAANSSQSVTKLTELLGDKITLSTDNTEVYFTDINGNTHTLADSAGSASFTLSGNAADGYEITLTDASGNVKTINEDLTSGEFHDSLAALNSKETYDTTTATYKGIGHYKGMLDTFANTFATVLNNANSSNGNNKPLFESIDGGPITAGNIQISEQWKNATGVYLTTTKQNPAGDTIDNVQNMIFLLQDGTDIDFNTSDIVAGKGSDSSSISGMPIYSSSFKTFFNQIGIEVGTEMDSVTQKENLYLNTINNIVNLRSSMSSVSIDEEAINLIMFNQSLTAASRFMTTLDEALQTIISSMGIVGR